MKSLFLTACVAVAAVSSVFAQSGGKAIALIKMGDAEYEAAFNSSEAARELFELFPLSVEMKEWAGNSEFYSGLGKTLSMDAPKVFAFKAGDIALYNERSLVIFYAETSNTANYVKVGEIKTPNSIRSLKSELTNANGKVTFGKGKTEASSSAEKEVYDIYLAICDAMIKKGRAHLKNILTRTWFLPT